MAILLVIDEVRSNRTEIKNIFVRDHEELHRNCGIIDAVDFINGIDYDNPRESVEIQTCTKVNEYIRDMNIPNNMWIYIMDNNVNRLYIYDWRGGYLLEVPRTFRH